MRRALPPAPCTVAHPQRARIKLLLMARQAVSAEQTHVGAGRLCISSHTPNIL